MKTNANKNKKSAFISTLLALAITLCIASCGDGGNANTDIQFKGGSCKVSTLDLQPMFAPADMKDNEKAFMLRLLYKLDDGVSRDALSVLYDEGQFVAPNGTAYKAGVSAVNDSLYSLIVAVPSDVDVETLKYEYNKQTVSLKQK